MISVFALPMSDTTLLCSKIFYTYLGKVMVPNPYLLTFWHKVLDLAFKIAYTDL